MAGHEMIGTLYPACLEAFYRAGVRPTPDHRLQDVRRGPDGLVAVPRNGYSGQTVERVVDQVVVEHGTVPNAELYLDMRGGSSNIGEVDLDAFVHAAPQRLTTNPAGLYQLFRLGYAVDSRNIHAAMFDARRLALSL
jgi:hypothetical protein